MALSALLVGAHSVSGPSVDGGAQRVGSQIAAQLRRLGWKVVSAAPSDLKHRNCLTLPESGYSQSGAEHGSFVDTLANTDLLISLDRRLPVSWPHLCPRVLQLSNLAYPNEVAALDGGRWDQVWVPSSFLAASAARICPRASVSVIPPAIALRSPSRVVADQWAVLLPHRFDPLKGWEQSIDLCSQLRMRDQRWTASVLVKPETERTDSQEFGSVEAILNGRSFVRFRPWQPASSMQNIFESHGVTLFLTELPEGFGLVALESVASGTPVVATRQGNLPALAASIGGIFFVDEPGIAPADMIMALSGHRLTDSIVHGAQEVFSTARQRSDLEQALRTLCLR